MAFTEFFSDLSDLDRIDWEVMRSTYWHDTPDDSDRSRRRQAEFLVRDFVPFELITEIGVYNDNVLRLVEKALRDSPHQPTVRVCRKWYYD